MNKNLIILKNNKHYYFIFSFVIAMFILFLYFYQNMETYESKLKNLLLNYSIEIIDKTSENILDEIIEENLDFVKTNLENHELRYKNEKTLELLRNKDIQELYVLYPSNNQLFFLLDTAKKNRGEVDELFSPKVTSAFAEVLKTGKKVTYIQDHTKNLGFTLIKPIVQNKKVMAFLVVDYSQKSLSSLSKLLTLSVNSINMALFFVFVIFLLILYYLGYRNYVKYKIYYNTWLSTTFFCCRFWTTSQTKKTKQRKDKSDENWLHH